MKNPSYVTYCITGWVPNEALAVEITRHFYRFECREATPDQWTVRTDNHVFKLFWARLDTLPAIRTSRRPWLDTLLASEDTRRPWE